MLTGPSLGTGSHFGFISLSLSLLLLSVLQNFMEHLLSARPRAGVGGPYNSFGFDLLGSVGRVKMSAVTTGRGGWGSLGSRPLSSCRMVCPSHSSSCECIPNTWPASLGAVFSFFMNERRDPLVFSKELPCAFLSPWTSAPKQAVHPASVMVAISASWSRGEAHHGCVSVG